MKINRSGDMLKKQMHKFKCHNCGCKYTADNGEWEYCDKYGYPKTNPTDYVMCRCPECNKSNRIQWRGMFKDWCEAYIDKLLVIVALLTLLLFFVFIGTEHYIAGITSIIISTISYGILVEVMG